MFTFSFKLEKYMSGFKQKYICRVFEKLQKRRDHLGSLLFLTPSFEVEIAKFDPKKQMLLVSMKQHTLVHLFVNSFFEVQL